VIAEVWTLLDGECTQETRERLRRHLEACPECFKHYGIEERIKTLIAAKCSGEKGPPRGLAGRRLRLEDPAGPPSSVVGRFSRYAFGRLPWFGLAVLAGRALLLRPRLAILRTSRSFVKCRAARCARLLEQSLHGRPRNRPPLAPPSRCPRGGLGGSIYGKLEGSLMDQQPGMRQWPTRAG